MEIIVAMSQNRVIGKNNAMPWHIPEDLTYFKEKTKNHSIIMGRKTFESIGRILPHRENIILTAQKGFQIEGAKMAYSEVEILQSLNPQKRYFIIGGGDIFRIFLPYVDKMWITQIHQNVDGDTFFPEYQKDFSKISESQKIQSGKIKFSYSLWEKSQMNRIDIGNGM